MTQRRVLNADLGGVRRLLGLPHPREGETVADQVELGYSLGDLADWIPSTIGIRAARWALVVGAPGLHATFVLQSRSRGGTRIDRVHSGVNVRLSIRDASILPAPAPVAILPTGQGVLADDGRQGNAALMGTLDQVQIQGAELRATKLDWYVAPGRFFVVQNATVNNLMSCTVETTEYQGVPSLDPV